MLWFTKENKYREKNTFLWAPQISYFKKLSSYINVFRLKTKGKKKLKRVAIKQKKNRCFQRALLLIFHKFHSDDAIFFGCTL